MLGKAPIQLRNALRAYANNIGLAFQIRDDLLDAKEDDIERMDKSAGKATLVEALGADKARRQAEMLCEQAVAHLEVFDKRADVLKELANFIVKRKH
jgi:farnesyl diphosphate synthase